MITKNGALKKKMAILYKTISGTTGIYNFQKLNACIDNNSIYFHY